MRNGRIAVRKPESNQTMSEATKRLNRFHELPMDRHFINKVTFAFQKPKKFSRNERKVGIQYEIDFLTKYEIYAISCYFL